MNTIAIVLEQPMQLALKPVQLTEPSDDDLVIDVEWSGVSTGTERLLWSGRMPAFPGMGYPLVPGYESVGRVRQAGANVTLKTGTRVFVPGASCYADARGLFGGSARRVITAERRVAVVPESLEDQAILLALAATACHAIAGGAAPDLIIGHGVLGRLLARAAIALGNPAPTVWEIDPSRAAGAVGYQVTTAEQDPKRDYRAIYDVSGAGDLLNALIGRLAPGGEVVLAGFYEAPLSFEFAPAFLREARIRVAAEWKPTDLATATRLVETDKLSLNGLITHHSQPQDAAAAYATAFSDPACLKMVLDWRELP
jgi:bacteriochlorophyllide a dehydrogenase